MSAERKLRAGLLSGLLLFALLAGCASKEEGYPAPELLEPRGVSLDTAVVTRGEIWRTTVLEGVVVPGVRELSFAASGMVKEVYVSPGSHVKEGDLLAAMDVSYYESALEAQRELLTFRQSSEDIARREQDIQIELEELALADLKDSGAGETALRLKELDIEKLKAERKEERALWELDRAALLDAIEKLEAQVEAARLLAPCDGTVVSCMTADGSYAMEKVGVLLLAEDAELYLSVEQASTTELRNASEIYATVGGKRVEVQLRTGDDRDYVPRLSSTGDSTSAFTIVDDNGNPVEAGMSAVVFILSDRTEDALIVPATAIRFDGGYYVYQMVDGAQVRRSVKCGVMNDGEAQVLEGLQEGDVVYAGT